MHWSAKATVLEALHFQVFILYNLCVAFMYFSEHFAKGELRSQTSKPPHKSSKTVRARDSIPVMHFLILQDVKSAKAMWENAEMCNQ